MKATAKDLRVHTKRLLDAVDRGEEVLITRRGEPQARLVPVRPAHGRIRAHTKLFGLWRDHAAARDVERYVDQLREPRA